MSHCFSADVVSSFFSSLGDYAKKTSIRRRWEMEPFPVFALDPAAEDCSKKRGGSLRVPRIFLWTVNLFGKLLVVYQFRGCCLLLPSAGNWEQASSLTRGRRRKCMSHN